MTIDEIKWKLYNYKSEKLLLWGLKKGYISIYDDELIKKLRNIYYGGIPASILLLSNVMSNGFCYDRALLLAQAFLNDDEDVNLIYATIDGLKLNPYINKKNNSLYSDHCFVERITKDNKHYIYDTSEGLIYDKKLYWLMENPKIRNIKSKDKILEYINSEYSYNSENLKNDKYMSPLIIPMIEKTYGKLNELYSMLGIELLKREVEHYKKLINYDEVVKEIEKNVKEKGLKI